MTKLEKIEKEIESLSKADLLKLADWFAQHYAELWDKQIESDIASGKLDRLASQALADHQSGSTKPL